MNWQPIEPWLHRAGGFLTEAVNLRLIWFWRERRQLPPENDRYPVLFIEKTPHNRVAYTTPPTDHDDFDEYWAKARVLDMLKDLEEAAQGGTVGWLWPLAYGVLIGWWVWG